MHIKISFFISRQYLLEHNAKCTDTGDVSMVLSYFEFSRLSNVKQTVLLIFNHVIFYYICCFHKMLLKFELHMLKKKKKIVLGFSIFLNHRENNF